MVPDIFYSCLSGGLKVLRASLGTNQWRDMLNSVRRTTWVEEALFNNSPVYLKAHGLWIKKSGNESEET